MVETFFTEKRIIKKIIIAIVFIFLFNFTFSYLGNNVVFAVEEGSDAELVESDEGELEEGGGKLLLPIHSLVMFIADAAMQLLQNSFLTSEPITLEARSDDERSAGGVGWIIGGIAITAVAILTWISPVPGDEAVGTSVAATWWAAGAGAKVLTTIALTTTVAGPSMVAYGSGKLYKNLQGKFKLPNIWYTPAEIFAGKVPLFDINFFKPAEDVYVETEEISVDKDKFKEDINEAGIYIKNAFTGEVKGDIVLEYMKAFSKEDFEKVDSGDGLGIWGGPGTYIDFEEYGGKDNKFILIEDDVDKLKFLVSLKDVNYLYIWVNEDYLYLYEVSQHGLLAGGVEWKLSKAKLTIEDDEVTNSRVVTYTSSSRILQSTVSSMYKTLRTVAIVALLSILVYVGIRMVISSASKDKAKYKQMLVDWLVAFILLFVLHYFMAFIINICEALTGICAANDIDICTIEIPGNTEIKDELTENWGYIWESESSQGYGEWPTSFVGAIRWDAGLVQKTGYTVSGIAATIMYVVLVIYIIIFTFQYMKRVLYMAFLTMIAPLVAITYPLDKINDGKAQGFNMWLKEYIFNALLQPIHYIIYVIIMGSVMQLVLEHPVYALVALGFMVPAEKFIRKMFGFEKASTVGTFGAAAGAAALMGGLQKLRHNPHGKKNDDNGAKGDKDDPNGKVRTISAMPDGPNNPGGGNHGLPGGSNAPRPEYEQFLGEMGYGRNLQPENRWDSRLTEEQIDYAREKGIDEPKGPEYEQFLGELGYGRSTSTTNMQTPRPQLRPNPEPTVDLMSFATRRPRPTPSAGTRRNIYNKPNGFINGVRAVGGHYKRRLDNRLRKAHPLRALRRGLTFGAGALTLGTIGLAAGIASGDPSKALQYTVAGGTAGGYLGRNMGETASNIVGLEGAAKSFKAGALGDEYDKLERAKYRRDFKNNVSNYDVGVRSVGVDGWKDMSKDGGIIDTGIDYGINNVNDLGNIYKAKEEFKNQYGMNDEEAQDWAFKAYKLDQNFGDWGKNSKTRENLDKLLIAKGYEDKTQREDVTKKMVETMGVYQDVALDKEIEEIKPDYTRITRQTEDNNSSENEREHQDDYRDNRQPEIPIQQTTVNEQEETARRANAESEANKAAVRQKQENRKIQEELEARAKADKKAERRAKTEAAKQRAAKQKEKNNVRNGKQGSQVRDEVDPDKRVIKPKTKEVNPISSDLGTNGNGPIDMK